MAIKIIEERCPALKEFCQPIVQCPVQAITHFEDTGASFGGRIKIDPFKCNDCLVCLDLCCGQALVMENLSVDQN